METLSASTRSARGRGRPKVAPDEEVAQRVVRAAFAILCAEGYAGMNMNEVAARCGISKKTIYRLFPGKLSLFRSITDLHRGAMVDVRPEFDDMPLIDALMIIFRMDLDERADEARRAFMRVAFVESAQTPELKQILEAHGRDQAFSELADWLERQRSRGRIMVDDAQVLTKLIIDVAFGAILHPGPEAWPGTHDRARYLRTCFELLVGGIAPNRPSAAEPACPGGKGLQGLPAA
jgi:AcrR family transcriptional regulator